MGLIKLIIAVLIINWFTPKGTTVEIQVLMYAILFAGWIAHKGGGNG